MPNDPTEAEALSEWYEYPSDGDTCFECKQIIVGTVHQYVLFGFGEPIYSKFKFCEYCIAGTETK